ncbi:TrAP protein [Pepper yellow dwarf virus - Mexico]|uniref:TrAP protein n=1 Tax=Pepper yellow dwarf virus - Mexico TaxID=1987360 RepID=UPI000A36B30F|nr:TrAP protein [Pepper yellow dwarf virus - Mexico]ARR74677.1 TrAP protein [Pepper yellow dwarf virus - Mexico]
MKPLGPGHYKIQSSPKSAVLSLIKIQKRPRKVNLPCKCHFTIHHECNQGFSHRGTYHASTGDEFCSRGFSTESTILQTPLVREVRNGIPTQSPDQIQPQPPQILESSQVLDGFDDHWITQDIDWRPFFESLEEPSGLGNQKTIFSLN